MFYQFRKLYSADSTSPFYPEWIHPTIPIYLGLYMFNVTNVEEILHGGRYVDKHTEEYTIESAPHKQFF